MSVQAMAWALDLSVETLRSPTARHVLLCLANYAGQDGRHAFPSVDTLTQNTGLSERTVRKALRELETSGLISRGNQAIVAAHIPRADQRPVVYDLPLPQGQRPARGAPRTKQKRGAGNAPRENGTGCTSVPDGVHLTTERGAGDAPEPSYNHPEPGSGPAAGLFDGPLQGPLKRLEREISSATFQSWFRAVKVDPNEPFHLRAPSAFIRNQISAHYLHRLQALVAADHPDARVVISEVSAP